jgi:hypothetical protein
MVPTGNARHRRGWRCNFGVDENPLGFEIKMQNCKQKKGDAFGIRSTAQIAAIRAARLEWLAQIPIKIVANGLAALRLASRQQP